MSTQTDAFPENVELRNVLGCKTPYKVHFLTLTIGFHVKLLT